MSTPSRARQLGSPLYEQVREILLRYSRAMTIDAVLPDACLRAGFAPLALELANVESMLQALTPGMRMFCRDEEVTRLMLELAALLE